MPGCSRLRHRLPPARLLDSGTAATIAGQIAALSADLLPGARLTVGQRISASRAAKPVRCSPIAIGGAAAMLWVVLPSIAAALRRCRQAANTTCPADATDGRHRPPAPPTPPTPPAPPTPPTPPHAGRLRRAAPADVIGKRLPPLMLCCG